MIYDAPLVTANVTLDWPNALRQKPEGPRPLTLIGVEQDRNDTLIAGRLSVAGAGSALPHRDQRGPGALGAIPTRRHCAERAPSTSAYIETQAFIVPIALQTNQRAARRSHHLDGMPAFLAASRRLPRLHAAGAHSHFDAIVYQLRNGVRAFHATVNTLLANWAYMVMASLAWSLAVDIGLLAALEQLLDGALERSHPEQEFLSAEEPVLESVPVLEDQPGALE